jgi:hypothetical protein
MQRGSSRPLQRSGHRRSAEEGVSGLRGSRGGALLEAHDANEVKSDSTRLSSNASKAPRLSEELPVPFRRPVPV